MTKSKNKKICIVVHSLGSGGAEKSSALLSQMMHQLGHEVHIISVINDIAYDYKGILFNLGELKDKNDTIFGRISRLFKFKHYLKQHDFDVVIDNRSRMQAYREVVISKLIYRLPVVYVVHSFKSETTFTKYTWLNKWLYKNEWMTFVSKEAQQKFTSQFGLKKTMTLYNGFDFEAINQQAESHIDMDEFILFYGRIDDKVKNLKLLLEAYKQSKLATESIKLLILGNGPDVSNLTDYAKTLNIDKFVVFKDFVANPYPYVKRAKFAVLTSRFEGFPMVLPEALSLGTPVISVNCESGPKEVITNGYNGLLVENYNAQALADAMNSFIFDTKLYQTCKTNAKQSVAQFSVAHIAKDWQKLLNTIDD